MRYGKRGIPEPYIINFGGIHVRYGKRGIPDPYIIKKLLKGRDIKFLSRLDVL